MTYKLNLQLKIKSEPRQQVEAYKYTRAHTPFTRSCTMYAFIEKETRKVAIVTVRKKKKTNILFKIKHIAKGT